MIISVSYTHLDVYKRQLQKCPNCGEYKRAHRVCPACGMYNGRQVLSKKEEA